MPAYTYPPGPPARLPDHALVQSWFSQSGGSITLPPGTYTIDPATHGPLTIPSGTTVRMSPGTILQCAPQPTSTFDMILLDDVENVAIEGGQIIGDRVAHVGTTGEHGMGVRIENSRGVTLSGVRIADHWGDCVYIGGGSYPAGESCREIRLEGCTLTNARRQGVSITHADGVTIDGCTITNINGTLPEYGVDVETNDAAYPCFDISVTGCTFSGSAGGGFIVGSPAERVTVSGCTFDGDGMNLTQTIDGTVSGCVVQGADIGVSAGSARVAVSGNIVTNGSIGLYSTSTPVEDVAISGNVLTSADGNTDRKGLTVTGTVSPARVSIYGNTVAGYVSESLFCYMGITGGVIYGNVFTSPMPSRWLALLRGSLTVAGNRFVTSSAAPFSGEGTPSSILSANDIVAP